MTEQQDTERALADFMECPDCAKHFRNGHGRPLIAEEIIRCGVCAGRGYDFDDYSQLDQKCPACNGAGTLALGGQR